MKISVLLRLSTLLVLLFLATLAQAQTRPAVLPGYWNVETNLTTRDYSIVRFYNAQDQLVYEERVADLCLDLSRNTGCRRVRRQLNDALQLALRNPTTIAQTPTMLAQQLGQSRRVQRTYASR
jgi:hypothetical protein